MAADSKSEVSVKPPRVQVQSAVNTQFIPDVVPSGAQQQVTQSTCWWKPLVYICLKGRGANRQWMNYRLHQCISAGDEIQVFSYALRSLNEPLLVIFM